MDDEVLRGGVANAGAARIRQAVRALVVDGCDRVLLVRFEFPTATRWALPGGGLEGGETHHDALRRELVEEVGLHDAMIGAHLWNRLHIVTFLNGLFDGQREQVYEVRVPAGFEPRPVFTWEQLNAEYVFEMRWWTLAELESTDSVFVPSTLSSLFRDYVGGGPPVQPLDLDG